MQSVSGRFSIVPECIGSGGFASGSGARPNEQLCDPISDPYDPSDKWPRHSGWPKYSAQGYCGTYDLPH